LRNRIRLSLVTFVSTLALLASAIPAHAVVAAPKVVIIVGPTGSLTDGFRSQGDSIADAATAAGAEVTKVYSPDATWDAVKTAVDGANVIVYLGHGNGYPNPYNTKLYDDRDDGWGLNRTTSGGDSDNYSTNMVYCGAKALLGTLTSSDGSAQLTYCTGGPITPAPGFVMVYSDACYAPGASESWDTPATESQAIQRAGYYSRPILAGLGGSAYFATDGGAAGLVASIVSNPDTSYGDLYNANLPSGMTVSEQAHPFVSGVQLWLGLGSQAGSYKYAFAGDPAGTFSGGTASVSSGSTSSWLDSVTTYSPAATLAFPGGTTTGYTFDSAGNVTGHKSYSLSRSSAANTSKSSTAIPGHPGTWYYVVNGVWAGYWVKGSSGLYLVG
jgi:hypothetical protein